MTAYPLQQPISSLSPTRRMYVVQRGLVFLYPASIVYTPVDAPTYTMNDDRPWNPTPADWESGRLLSDRLDLDLVDHAELKSLARTLWISEGGGPAGFAMWWADVNPDAHPEWIGAAARVAARELMTWPLFHHRHMVDESRTVP